MCWIVKNLLEWKRIHCEQCMIHLTKLLYMQWSGGWGIIFQPTNPLSQRKRRTPLAALWKVFRWCISLVLNLLANIIAMELTTLIPLVFYWWYVSSTQATSSYFMEPTLPWLLQSWPVIFPIYRIKPCLIFLYSNY